MGELSEPELETMLMVIRKDKSGIGRVIENLLTDELMVRKDMGPPVGTAPMGQGAVGPGGPTAGMDPATQMGGNQGQMPSPAGPLTVGSRVFCKPAGLTGTVVGMQNGRVGVKYDLGMIKWELPQDLRPAGPGETTGTKGLDPQDKGYAQQQAEIAASNPGGGEGGIGPGSPVDKAKKWTEASDLAWDKKRGIKQGSPRDNALDRKRGVPVRKQGPADDWAAQQAAQETQADLTSQNIPPLAGGGGSDAARYQQLAAQAEQASNQAMQQGRWSDSHIGAAQAHGEAADAARQIGQEALAQQHEDRARQHARIYNSVETRRPNNSDPEGQRAYDWAMSQPEARYFGKAKKLQSRSDLMALLARGRKQGKKPVLKQPDDVEDPDTEEQDDSQPNAAEEAVTNSITKGGRRGGSLPLVLL